MSLKQFIETYIPKNSCSSISVDRNYCNSNPPFEMMFSVESPPHFLHVNTFRVRSERNGGVLLSGEITDHKLMDGDSIIPIYHEIEKRISYDDLILLVQHISKNIDLIEHVKDFYNEFIKREMK